jgi:hypothetical protein
MDRGRFTSPKNDFIYLSGFCLYSRVALFFSLSSDRIDINYGIPKAKWKAKI